MEGVSSTDLFLWHLLLTWEILTDSSNWQTIKHKKMLSGILCTPTSPHVCGFSLHVLFTWGAVLQCQPPSWAPSQVAVIVILYPYLPKCWLLPVGTGILCSPDGEVSFHSKIKQLLIWHTIHELHVTYRNTLLVSYYGWLLCGSECQITVPYMVCKR